MTGDIKISVQNLHKKFAAFSAIDNISFTLRAGEVLGFLGPNGAGKSTTMKMITGFMMPDSGSIEVNGLDVQRHVQDIKKIIGYLPEGAPAYGDMSTVGFLGFIADIRGYKGQQKKHRIDAAIEKLNLSSVYHKTIENLSKGFKRRVGLAQAILHDPLILIMDEPTDGLDPNQKHEVRQLINDMSDDKAILISTHILEEVDAICSRAVILNQGKIVFDGTPPQLQAMSKTHNSVRLNLREFSQNDVLVKLRMLENVYDAYYETGSGDFVIVPHHGASIINQLAHLAHDECWIIQNIFVTTGQLDEVFRLITS